MLEGKATVKETDMPLKMQIQAMSSASHALDLFDVSDCISVAAHIKKEFDKMYGSGWQCVVGSNFGCFFTHSPDYASCRREDLYITKGLEVEGSSSSSSNGAFTLQIPLSEVY